MPELLAFTLIDSAYTLPSTDFEFVFFGDSGSLTLTVACSENCTFGFRWACDNQLIVIDTDTYTLVGGVTQSVTVPIVARWVQVFVENIANSPASICNQVFFFDRRLTLAQGPLTNTGTGIPLFTAPSGIKSLTSVDNSVLITDNLTEIDLSAITRAGLVTVGVVNADYLTIYDAVADMKCNMRVITDVVETLQTDMTVCSHLRLELVPGITLSNTIAGAGDWFVGDNNLLKIEGAGAHMDLTTTGLSSQITLQSGQTFHWGTDAELDVSGIRFTGAGNNVILSGSSRVRDCRFDGSTRVILDLFERNLFIDGCLFTVPVTIDSLVGLEPKNAIISNNVFTSTAGVFISGATDLIFISNIVGSTITSTGTLTKTKIADNNIGGNLDVLTLQNVVVSNNIIMGNLSINNTVSDTVFDGNTISGVFSSSAQLTSNKITNNCIVSNLNLQNLNSCVIGDNVFDTINLVDCINSSITGNVMTSITNNTLHITGICTQVTISNNKGANEWILGGDFSESTMSSNNIATGNISSGDVTFQSLMHMSIFNGNSITGDITTQAINSSSAITDNRARIIVISGDISNSRIISNNFVASQPVAMTFNGNLDNSVISENTTIQDMVVNGTVDNVVISNNIIQQFVPGTVGFMTFNNIISNSTITGNNVFRDIRVYSQITNTNISNNIIGISLTIDPTNLGTSSRNTIIGNTVSNDIAFGGNITGCSISSNTVDRLIFSSNVENSQILGNSMLRTNSGTLTITGSSSVVIISSNVGYHNWLFTGTFTGGTINDNRITSGTGTGNIQFSSIFDDSTITGNTFVGSVIITGGASRSVINGNRIGVSILIDLSNAGNSNRNTINSNVCGATIQIGALPAGIIENVITGNVAPTSIVSVSNLTNNIVTSNRTPVGSIAGFGGGDVIANNV